MAGWLLHRRWSRSAPRADRTIAADNAIFGQTGPKSVPRRRPRAPPTWLVSSGRKKREKSGSRAVSTTQEQALDMGLVNTVVPLADLEKVTVRWCRERWKTARWRCAARKLRRTPTVTAGGAAGAGGNATMLFS
ncbi:enoyl-CoA hydratase-related protein [Shigella flexneri]